MPTAKISASSLIRLSTRLSDTNSYDAGRATALSSTAPSGPPEEGSLQKLFQVLKPAAPATDIQHHTLAQQTIEAAFSLQRRSLGGLIAKSPLPNIPTGFSSRAARG
jgi:hypothetical protein